MKKKSYSNSQWLYLSRALLILFLLLFNYSEATSQNQRISLPQGVRTISSAFDEIEKQTQMTIAFNESLIDVNKNIDVNITNSTLSEALNSILKGTNATYKIEGRQIIIVEAPKPVPNKRYTGLVSDESGESIIGATVTIKEKSIGTMTKADGTFSIEAPVGSTLLVSYIGYVSQEIKLREKQSIDIKMYEESKRLNEVVVTALGIKREEKSLGYSISKIEGDEIIDPTSNFLGALSGKVAGLNMDKASTGPGGSVRVTLRGESSLNLSNNGALFVVDGVPISSDMTAAGSSAHNVGSGDMPIDFGNGASDINPEDIESISILKGSSATALYGSRAANGAIIITTKSGKPTGKLGVTYSSTFVYEEVSRWPDLQNEYGSGGIGKDTYYSYGSTSDGASTHSSLSWGPRFEGQMYYQIPIVQAGINVDQDGNRIPTEWKAHDNWFKGFFKPGHTLTNTVTISGGNDMGNMRLSFTDRRNDWIMENIGFSDQRLSFSGKQDITKRITIESKVNYYHKSSDNLPTVGYGPTSVMYSLLTTSPNINMDWYRNYWREGEENVLQDNRYNTNADNPYFIVYEQTNSQKRDRVFGNINMNIKLLKNLDFMIRSGLDLNNESRAFIRPLSSVKTPNGEYREQTIMGMEMNSDFMLKYNKRFGNEHQFNITASLGGNNMVTNYKSLDIRAESLQIPGVYRLSNAKDRLLTKSYERHKIVNSLYGLVQFSYLSSLFVDITGRSDWSSALALENNPYFYPSISTSFIPTDFFHINNPYLTFAKIRLSFAMVGNDTAPYRLSNDYSTSNFGGSYMLPVTANNPDLKPEMVTSYEIGTEVRLFRNKIGLDLTYYLNNNENLILSVPVDPASGAQYLMMNAGKTQNSGWELSMFYTPVKTRDLTWTINGTWSKNTNKVLSLADNVDSWIITSGPRGTIEARVGGSISSIYGSGFVKAPEGAYITNENGSQTDVSGEVLYDASTGYPLVDVTTSKYLGDCAPDWKASLGSSIKYRRVTAKILFDGQMGGKVYSLSYQKLNQFGKLQQTTIGRYGGLVGDGVVLNSDGTYSRNTTVTQSIGEYYTRYYQIDNVEANLVNTSYLKLREISLSYSVPKKIVDKLKVIESLSCSVYGRDLYCWTKYPIFDPEVATLNNAEITPGFETAQLPSTRSIGATIKVSF